MVSRRSLLFLWSLLLAVVVCSDAEAVQEPITRISSIKALMAERAVAALPVKVTGVVIEAEVGTFVIHDGSEGLFVEGKPGEIPSFGSEVIVEGTTALGEFSPMLRAGRVTKLGSRELLPRVIRDVEELEAGASDCQWVEVEGLLRSAQPPTSAVPCYTAYAVLASGMARLSLSFSETSFAEVQKWVGSRVRLRAACLHYFNPHGQLYGARLVVPRSAQVQVLEPALPREAVSLSSIESLLRYSPREPAQGRVHVRGVVTYQRGDDELYIQEGLRGVYVRHTDQRKLALGDVVDVFGFVRRGVYSPEIEDAETVVVGRQEALAPRPVSGEAARKADGELVQVEAVLLDFFHGEETTVFTLKAEAAPFTAVLPQRTHAEALPTLGSQVRLTGVVRILQAPRVGAPFPWTPDSFELRLRTEGDLLVLQKPGLSPALWVLGIATLLSSVALLVAGMLWWQSKAKLREQKRRRIAREAEFAAMIKERMRLAREIHDSLAQGFTAVSIQLEIAKYKLPPEATVAQGHLETARALVRESLAEARRSIQGLRGETMTNADFLAALTRSSVRLFKDTGIDFHPELEGDLSRLGAEAENELLRIVTEAMTNTVKHAQAKNIRVSFRVEDDFGELRVSDDGVGISHGWESGQGFGLRGMRERAQRLNGHLVVTSEPGQGTHLIVRIPIQGSSCSIPSPSSL